MDKKDLIGMIETRLTSVKEVYSNVQKGIGASGKTLTEKAKPSVLAATKKDLNALLVIKELLKVAPANVEFSTAALEAFNAIATPSGKAKAITIEEGSNLLEAMKEYEALYPNAKEVSTRFMDAIEAQGFKLDGLTIVRK